MQILAQILIWTSLSIGVLAAATAYLAPPDADFVIPDPNQIAEKAEQPLKLTAAAGVAQGAEGEALVDAEGNPIAFIPSGEPVNQDLLNAIKNHGGIDYIQINEFSFARWPGKWAFAVASAGLIAGAVLMRRTTKKKLEGSDGSASFPPVEDMLAGIHDRIEALSRRLQKSSNTKNQLNLIVEQLDALEQQDMARMIAARDHLIAQYGTGGYAQIMAGYATAERLIHRAWSAAADGAIAESREALDGAIEQLGETVTSIPAPKGSPEPPSTSGE